LSNLSGGSSAFWPRLLFFPEKVVEVSMKKINSVQSAITGALLLALAAASPAWGRVDWEAGRTLKPEKPPLDVAGTADGKWTFVLAEGGKVYIYSADGQLNDTLEVGPGMDRIAVSGLGEKIYLSSNKDRRVQELLLDFIIPINTAGAPYLGAAEAPVELVVFSDFQ
jgi:hypothetical protein